MARPAHTHGAVGPDAWRSALREIALAADLTPQQLPYAEVVQALACDIQAMPGAVADVVEALRVATHQGSVLAQDWTQAMSDDYMAVATEFSKLISNEVKAMKLTDHTGMAERSKT
jgi:hypothetical protein